MFIADLHIHSSYSRATSKDCIPEYLDLWARRKGIGLLGTGDFTHPAWRKELKEKLQPAEEGLYELKDEFRFSERLAGREERPRFVLSGEISSIYKKNGRVRKVHNVILLPNLEAAERLSLRLEAIGNLHSDGRPILGLDSRDLLEITLDCCPQAIFIPAHIWTPHFSLFGAFSGFDTIEECFGDMTPYIHALETGLSSDPSMNWRLSALDGYTLVSNSDAHSPAKLGREANILHTQCSYPALCSALTDRDGESFAGTIEFFPEEGKYHFDGHRNCKLCLTPSETVEAGGKCPVCGKKITVGVLHRVESLADRPEGYRPPNGRPYESLIPLPEVIAACMGVSSASIKAKRRYEEMLHALGPEFYILREAPLSEIEREAGLLVAEDIRRMRCGQVEILPGYDGEYGKIHLLNAEEIGALAGQVSFFGVQPCEKKTAPACRKKANLPATPSAPDPVNEPSAPALSLSNPAPLLTGLNQEQKEAVTAFERAVAVIAGPGTGKTRTLVSRIVYLIKERGVKPSEITAVTFTNKAAAEMRERLQKELGSKHAVRGMRIGTFHAICLQLLTKRDGPITLLEDYEALLIAEDILHETGEKGSPQKLLHEISRRKNHLNRDGETTFSEEMFARYQARLKEYGVLDFDDLLLQTLTWFEEGTALAPYTKAFSYLLVDELQDINDVQYRLIRAWSQKNKSIFVIGDPDQAIYGFRGSNANCFARFALDYPGLREIRLVQNYRSTPEILQCALPVIAHNSAALPGGRLLDAKRANGEKVRLCTAIDDFSEAVWIAKEINRLVGGIDMLDAQNQDVQGRVKGFSDIAVLYRTHRQAHVLEKCLRTEGIPYVVVGRESLLSDPQVRGVLGFFRFLLNPRDILSLRICLKAVLHCPEEAAGRLLRSLAERGENIKPLETMIKECVDPFAKEPSLIKCAELINVFLPRVTKNKPQKLLADFVKESGLTQQPNLDKLLHMAVFHGCMAEFLENLTLGQESDIARSSSRAYSSDTVSLMTLHAAKGLEFPCVFLCGVRKGLLPLDMPGRITDVEEERRLFYVGITRAQEKLVLSASQEPSSFLSEIPQDALQKSRAMPDKKYTSTEQLRFF